MTIALYLAVLILAAQCLSLELRLQRIEQPFLGEPQ